MKVLYISSALIPSKQANSIHIMKMASALSENGNDVLLLCRKNSKYEIKNIFSFYGVKNNFKISYLPYPNIKFGNYIFGFFCFLKTIKFKPNYVIGRFFIGLFLSSLVCSKVFLELHQPLVGGLNFQRRLLSQLIKFNSFKKLIVISKPLYEIFNEEFNIPKNKLLVASDASDAPKFYYENKFEKSKRLQVGYIGHLYKGRGIELMLNLAKKLPSMDFHIVGGNNDDIKRVKKQSQFLRNLNIHGFIFPSETENFRQKMNVLLAPYQKKVGLLDSKLTTEKWMSPLKIFEYMGSGRAILSSDIPVLREVLKNNINCLMLNPNNIKDWINALRKLESNPEFMLLISKKARKDFLRNYTWTKRAQNIINSI